MIERGQNGLRAISMVRLRALVVAVLGPLLTGPAWGDEPMLAILSDRPDAVVHIDGKPLGALPPIVVESATCGGGMVRLPDWKWHKIDVFLDGIRASGPTIVQASSNQISAAIFRFARDNDVAGLGSLRTERLPTIGETRQGASPPVTKSDLPGKDDSVPHVHAAEPAKPAATVSDPPPSPKPPIAVETRTGTVNVSLPKDVKPNDIARLVAVATGETVARQVLRGNDLAIRFPGIPGMRLYLAELVRDERVVGASAPVILGKNGIWTPFLSVRLDPLDASAPKESGTTAEAKDTGRENGGNFTVEVACPAAGGFEALCQELRRLLDHRGIRWARAIQDDEVDAYLSAYGYPEGGPALLGEPVSRIGGRPVVYAGKRYVFVFSNFKLARNINAEQAFPGDAP